jgi:cell division protein FtsI/penicillin-binding protein 2
MFGLALAARPAVSDPRGKSLPDPLPVASKPIQLQPVAEKELRGKIILEKEETVDDRVEAPLADGRTAILTIDPDLQEKADAVLAEADAPASAIVVMDLDGALLALAGRSDDKLPLADLVGKPWAPSASVFKIVTSAALLDAGVTPEKLVCFHGGEGSVEPDNLVDSRHDDDCETLAYGLAHSQNAILAKLAVHHLDADALQQHADLLGYDAVPDVALPVEPSPAEIPTSDRLELGRAAAGFWHSSLSPLAAATLGATIASGGFAVQPHLLASIEGAPLAAPPPFRRVLSDETARGVARMMVGTTEDGTARNGFHDGRGRPYLDVDVAGKTGTLGKGKIEYSWFVGFAPADKPRYVIAVLLGNREDYRLKAHQAARMVLETALSRDTSEKK